MLTCQKNFELMIDENQKKDFKFNIKKGSDNGISMNSDNPGDYSAISAISSQLHDDKNKEYYDLKSQYLSDEIFFAKLTKKTINEPLMLTGNQMSLNREESSDKTKSLVTSSSWWRTFDFLRSGSLNSTIVLLMVATIGGG